MFGALALKASGTVMPAAASGASIVTRKDQTSTSQIGAYSVTLPSVQAGDRIVALFAGSRTPGGVTTAFSDSAGNTYNATQLVGGSGTAELAAATTTAAANATNLVVSADPSVNQNGQFSVFQIRGAGTIGTPATANATSLQGAGTTIETTPFSVNAGGILLYVGSAYISGASNTEFMVSSPSFTTDVECNPTFYGSGLDSQIGHVPSATALTNETATVTVTPNTSQYRANVIIVPVNAA